MNFDSSEFILVACNVCGRSYGRPNIKVYISNCRHVLCSVCCGVDGERACVLCQKKKETRLIGPELETKLLEYFRLDAVQNHLSQAFMIYNFQINQFKLNQQRLNIHKMMEKCKMIESKAKTSKKEAEHLNKIMLLEEKNYRALERAERKKTLSLTFLQSDNPALVALNHSSSSSSSSSSMSKSLSLSNLSRSAKNRSSGLNSENPLF